MRQYAEILCSVLKFRHFDCAFFYSHVKCNTSVFQCVKIAIVKVFIIRTSLCSCLSILTTLNCASWNTGCQQSEVMLSGGTKRVRPRVPEIAMNKLRLLCLPCCHCVNKLAGLFLWLGRTRQKHEKLVTTLSTIFT